MNSNLTECPYCHGPRALADHADSAFGKIIWIWYKCRDCGFKFRRPEYPRHRQNRKAPSDDAHWAGKRANEDDVKIGLFPLANKNMRMKFGV